MSVELLLGAAGLVVVILMVLAVLATLKNAPYQCQRCGRTLDGPKCPVCDEKREAADEG